MGSGEIIAAAAIVAGFGVTAIMFRVQRELYVLEVLKIGVCWLAWADYLIMASVILAVFGATVPLLIVPRASESLTAVAAASCVAALVLQAGYVPSILAHYRIAIGSHRQGPRERGEPTERLLVCTSVVSAVAAFLATIMLRSTV